MGLCVACLNAASLKQMEERVGTVAAWCKHNPRDDCVLKKKRLQVWFNLEYSKVVVDLS